MQGESIKRKNESDFSKPRQNSGELVSEVLSDKEKIPRKYLDKKKMFAEINLNNNRHGK